MGEIRYMIESRAGRRFARLAEELDDMVARAHEGLMDDAEIAFQATIPKDTTRAARSIHTVKSGPGTYEVIADAVDPHSGFHYIGVTRFGHRKAWITPRRRRPASVISTRRARGRGRRANLRFVINGEVMFRKRVRGVVREKDWAAETVPEIQREAHDVMTRLGQRISVRFG